MPGAAWGADGLELSAVGDRRGELFFEVVGDHRTEILTQMDRVDSTGHYNGCAMRNPRPMSIQPKDKSTTRLGWVDSFLRVEFEDAKKGSEAGRYLVLATIAARSSESCC